MLISSGAGSSGTDSFTSDACAGMQSSGSSGGSGRSKLAGFALHLGRCCGCMLGGRCNMRVRKIEIVLVLRHHALLHGEGCWTQQVLKAGTVAVWSSKE